MIRGIYYTGIRSNLHARIVRIAAEVHQLAKSDMPVVVSTSIDHLLHYAGSYALAPASTKTRFVWMLLDSSDLAFDQRTAKSNIRKLIDSHNISLEIYAVGDLGGLLDKIVEDVNVCLLYNQKKTLQFILKTRESCVKRLKLGFLPSYFYLAKDLYSRPRCAFDACLSAHEKLVFVGHSGLYTARKALRGVGMFDWETRLQNLCLPFEGQKNFFALDDSIKHWHVLRSFAGLALQEFPNHAETTDSKAMLFILIRSLMRLLVVFGLTLTPSFMPVLSPNQFLNAMHWPSLLAPRFLDLGGINGAEQLYPRSVDLMMRNQRYIRISEADEFNYFCCSPDILNEYIQSTFDALESFLCVESQKTLRKLI